MEERHVIAVLLDERALSVLFYEGATVRCVNGRPRDAKLLGVHADIYRCCFVAFFEHPSFPVCGAGCEPERRFLGFEILEHPHADRYDMIPLRIGMDEGEYLDMQQWICERAAQIEGRAYTKRI